MGLTRGLSTGMTRPLSGGGASVGRFGIDFIADDTTPDAGQSVQFTATSSGGTPTVYAWDFGDGGTASTASPTHTYNSTGTFAVSLFAANARGSDTETKPGYIVVPATVGGGDLDWGGDSLLWGADPLNWS